MNTMWCSKLVCVILVVCCGVGWCAATSPWRMPHGLGREQLQNVFQMPTFRPRTRTTTSVAIQNSSSTTSLTSAEQNKSYKTFYRVYYGTPPASPDVERRILHRSNSQQHRSQESGSQELEDVRAANEHFLNVRTNFRCGAPHPRVVRVRDVYSDPSKEYLPRCTVLHRCSDDTGCCDNDDFQCVPRAVQEVALTFYVLYMANPLGSSRLSNSIEKLLFENHTECECQIIHDIPRSGGSHAHLSPSTTTTTTTSTSPPTTIATSTTAEPTTTSTTSSTTAAAIESVWKLSKCRECPVPFHRREYSDGRCSCDCFDRHKPCLKVKRGREPLTEVERRCVEAAHCHMPECEYGDYDYDTGKCPKRPDNYRRPPDDRGYVSNAHRWNFLERD